MAAEDAGTIAAQIRLELDQLERDGLQAQKMMDHYAREFKKEGEKGGKMYVQGFGKGQLELNKKLNEMVSSFQGISPKMGAFGDKLAKVFSKPIFSMIPAVSAAFQAMLPVIGTIIVVIGALMKGISAAAKSQKEFTDNVNLSKKAQDALSKTAKSATDISKKQNETEERKSVAMAKVRLAFHNMLEPLRNFGAAIKSLTDKVFLFFIERLEDITKGLGIFMSAIGVVIPGAAAAGAALLVFSNNLSKVSDEEARAAANAQLLKGVNEELATSYDDYEKVLKNIETAEQSGADTVEDAARAKLLAADSYMRKLIELRNATAAMVGETSNEVKQYDEAIKKQVALRDQLQGMIDEYDRLAEAKKKTETSQSDQDKIKAARDAANAEYEKAERKARDDMKAGLATEKEMEERINQALAQKYDALENIVAEYKLSWGETIRQRDAIAQEVRLIKEAVKEKERQKKINELLTTQEDELERQKIEQLRALAESANTEAKKNKLLDEAIDKENALILKLRERQKAEEMALIEFAGPEARKKWEDQFDAITKGLLKVKNNPISLFDTEAWQQGMSLAEESIGAFDEISGAALEVSRKHAEEQIAIIDSALQELQKQIEEAREKQLEAEGFIEAQSEEAFDKQIEAAKAAGDEVLQYQLQRRKREMEINKDYDDQAKAAVKKAAKDKADIEYKLAKEEYAMQMVNAISTGIQTVLNAYARGLEIPFAGITLAPVFAGIAGTASAVQIGLLAANPPNPPAFQSGGIVPGRKSDGDVQHIIATAGEVILNEAQQENIAGKLNGGGETVINNYLYLDNEGRELIAQSVIRYANTTGSVLEKRAIRGLR